MLKSRGVWLDDHNRKEQLAESDNSVKPTHFGYEYIARDQKTDRVIQHFNSVAQHYDFMNSLLSLGIHRLWKRTAVRMMELAPGDHILDICGGTADLAILAARDIGSTGAVIVYDINRAMIQAGLHKAAHKDIAPRIGYVQGNAETVSFPDRHFDAAMVGFGIRNVTNMKKGFEEMFRVLKPGGKMMCLEFSKPTFAPFRWLYDIYSFYVMPVLGELIAGSRKAYTHLPESIRMFPLPDELSDLLTKIGFSRVSHRSLTNGIAVIHLAIK
jgi:demethylmenaquinone methyltransferase/2-methoxy-6-polyprenyl-1,4-benzoquinol methylase